MNLRTGMLVLGVWSFAGAWARSNDADSFRRQVAPIFEQHCVACHQGPAAKGGLDLTSRASVRRGGESGPAIEPGKPDDSPLVESISGEKPLMPKDAPALSPREVDIVRRWIADGADWPDAVVLTDKRAVDGDWWSLVPLAKVDVPNVGGHWARTAVDAFVSAKLDEQHLAASPEADRPSLIRRLTYDLHGLPPTPAEIDAFVADARDDAYEELADRLLASPRYGERWGRYWLDVVHFGESHGYDKDKPRSHAWPYRDYVIRSLNEDKPYDRFVEEQIAGDVLYPEDPQATVATGFIAAGPWDFVGHVELREGTIDKEIARSNDRDDMVMTTMSTFTSMTVHCARCHDHKFDPIRQTDYYGLQAVFAGVDRADRPYAVDAQIEQQRALLAVEKERAGARLAAAQARSAKMEADAKAAQNAIETGKDEALREELAGAEHALKDVNQRISSLPPQPMVYAAASRFVPQGSFTGAGGPRPIVLLARGDVQSPREPVGPNPPACVQGPPSRFTIADDRDESQRRAALAHWLSDRRNALVRRSIVNRVWQHHFGQGLVDTPNDFGRMGSRPTHPELLEWLAGWFIDNGHSLKRLHRLLVTSAVYRQSSRNDPRYARLDASNRYLWHMNRQRLDAECTRDAMSAVSGKLDATMGGPSMQQFLFKDDHSPIYDYARFDADDPRGQRRSIYRFLVRSVPDPFMECLDCADPSILTPKRNTTLTSIQALALLNNPFVIRQSEHFADRLRSLGSDLPAQLDAACLLALGRRPTDDQRLAARRICRATRARQRLPRDLQQQRVCVHRLIFIVRNRSKT